MGLSACLKKAGAVIHADDKRAILARSQELRGQGLAANDAAKQAVQEQLGAVQAQLDARVEPRASADRRANQERRKTVDEMSPDEMRAALHTDELTGLRNRRWLEDHSGDFAHVVAFDADSLKWVNDNLGHDSGDELLRAWGEALRAAAPETGTRVGGDEFFAFANSNIEARKIVDAVRDVLDRTVITAKTPDGETVEIRGIGVSFGIGKERKAADEALNHHKRSREAAGERAGRGEAPPGTSRRPAQGEQDRLGEGGEGAAGQ